MIVYIFIQLIIECSDTDLGFLSSKSVMEGNGWNVDVEYSNENDWNSIENCSLVTFYGYSPNEIVGTVSANFKGSGEATLAYGNCFRTGYVLVSLNDLELGRVDSNSRANVTFDFSEGDILRIEEFESARIKLYRLTFEGCGKLLFLNSCIYYNVFC